MTPTPSRKMRGVEVPKPDLLAELQQAMNLQSIRIMGIVRLSYALCERICAELEEARWVIAMAESMRVGQGATFGETFAECVQKLRTTQCCDPLTDARIGGLMEENKRLSAELVESREDKARLDWLENEVDREMR